MVSSPDASLDRRRLVTSSLGGAGVGAAVGTGGGSRCGGHALSLLVRPGAAPAIRRSGVVPGTHSHPVGLAAREAGEGE